ncbi:3-methyladenine DNA glycosylase [Arthrobacter echini]|uniref:3-methyladenine DNA glycosylase n=1 Tax=Arthrobacter echini TaxID=1529066 RepID=A0A4S5E4Y8_9MICC|nr:3-methyladenine DNA glycosylase [Arthrobacter echini]THJ66490.1 3-methyladenine DNA glycosylase [Arthrobacter echini]
MSIAPALRPHGAEVAEWTPDGAYTLTRSIEILQCGSHDPSFIVQGPDHWLAFRTAHGPVTLLLRQRGSLHDSVVQAAAWGPGAASALEALPRLLGADDDWSDFDDPGFRATLPELARKGRYLNPGLRLPSSGRMLDTVARVVLEQKVTGLEAKRAWRYLLTRYGDTAPGAGTVAPAGLRLPPTAEQWRRIPSWDWHRAGVDAKRSSTILKAALVASGLERLASRQGESVRAGLRSVPGIGVWTVAEVVQRTHGCPDSISVGDYHLAAYVSAALTGRRTDDAGMVELLRPWAGQRQRVVRALYASGFRKQAFGPRLTPEDHRGR